jgi:hypothetical protein
VKSTFSIVFDVVKYKQIARGMSFRAAGSHMLDSHSCVLSDREKSCLISRGMSFRMEKDTYIYRRVERQDSRVKIQDAGCIIRDSRFAIQDSRYKMLDAQNSIFILDYIKKQTLRIMDKEFRIKKNVKQLMAKS